MRPYLRIAPFVCGAFLLLAVSCAPAPKAAADIARHPEPYLFDQPGPEDILRPNELGEIDLRCADLRTVSLTELGKGPLQVSFDDRTRWPETLPVGFDPEKLMELGKDPGLGVRALHRQGITGKGVGIAIIDQTLLADHQEYAGRLRYYEEFHTAAQDPASMHGGAVASIALGETVGVAPEALLYFIADDLMKGTGENAVRDLSYYAEDIDRFVSLNETLPEGERIRVISISAGYLRDTPGAEAMDAAIARANAAGVAVVLPGNGRFMGMGREPYGDPNDPAVCLPGNYWEDWLYNGELDQSETLLLPMDRRATASPTGAEDYVYYSTGGASWKVPYVAGLYALACQVKPDVTYEEFETAALAAAKPVRVVHEGEEYLFGNVVDPAALLETLH